MKFQPKTEEEVKAEKLLSVGECNFEVKSSKDEVSKSSGSEMIHLVLEVFDVEGERALVHDYLLESMPAKFRHFCYATGLGDVYENGTLDASACEGVTGRLKIRHEQDKTGQYPTKNSVIDYIAEQRTERRDAPSPKNETKAGDAAVMRSESLAKAWKKFRMENAGDTPESAKEKFSAAQQKYFNGRPHQSIGAHEWQQFSNDNFVKPAAPPDPFANEPAAFDDASIPF